MDHPEHLEDLKEELLYICIMNLYSLFCLSTQDPAFDLIIIFCFRQLCYFPSGLLCSIVLLG